ncbi:TonB-dependent receptor [Kordiimonas pumila]|uniref:TonB-dependent receptor domain-containing protein n=1 Tax=Kordiimonas pumila TaxID=2161677 RepID=A0ABV7DA24_9PROT
MKRQFRAALCTSVALAAMSASVPVIAQEITSSIRGTVTNEAGTPLAGETVSVTDTRTGATKTVNTNDSGAFSIRSLGVGGPFTIRVVSEKYQNSTITDVYTGLAGASSFNIVLAEADADVEEISVVAQKLTQTTVAVGPSSSFGIEKIEGMPSISRQVRDVVRLDPRVSIGRSSGGDGYGINCIGGNNRSNSFTIDGVRSADGFGLNASGNLARNTFPIPFDSMQAASVEFAPISVEYGQFTGCNVNVVTKSGTNEFHGSAFYVYNDGGLTGTKLDGDVVRTEPFTDKNWGAELGGPIIKDKLFFYVSYEETKGADNQNTGPAGAGFANDEEITLDEANQISDILSANYGRDTLGLMTTLPETSTRYFARIDWNLNDNHRLAATYARLEEENVEPDDFGFGGFTFGDNFEVEGSESNTYSVRLFSDWTDNFSTEIRLSRNEVTDLQDPLGGGEAQDNNIPRIEVEDGAGNVFFTSGPGEFRSANGLNYTLDQVKVAGDYVAGDHTISFGYELDKLEVYNLFVSNGTGTITFDDIAALEAGLASSISGYGSFSGDINDAAARFKRSIHSLYAQDEWQVNDALTFTAGVRYDWYSSSDVPTESQAFVDRYGFSNAVGFSGLDVLMPRVGLTYVLPEDTFGDTKISAGFGIFSGGDPTVWFSNAFSNFGSAVGFGSSSGAGCDVSDLQVLNGGSFTGIPDCIAAQQQADALAGTGRIDAVDPDLKLATQQCWSLGIAHYTQDTGSDFFDNWDIKLDLIYSKTKNAFDFVDLTLSPNGTTLPDGRDQLFAVDPLLAGCNAVFVGPRTGFSNADPVLCNAGGDDQDILLTNTDKSGSTKSLSLQFSKNFEISDRTFFDFRMGYAYTDATNANPGNSSTATSGFEEVALAQINYPTVGPAQYANKHNIVIAGTLDHDFVEDYTTSVSFFFRARSGRPFSYVYDNNTPTTLFGDSDNEERNLFYVPTGANDPLVDFSALEAAGTLDDFFEFLDASGLSNYAGEIAPRNGFEQNWSTDLDIRFQQELPTFFEGHKLELFVDFENILNLLGNGKNIQRYADFGDVGEGVPILDAALNADGSQYVYSNFNPGNSSAALSELGYNVNNQIDVDDSLWRIQVGIKYKF